MAHPELFRLTPDDRLAREAAERLFDEVKPVLDAILPPTAKVLHVGATSIPGCLTKGDLDIVVRVDPNDFAAAEATLAARFARNLGSTRTRDFAAFEDSCRTPHLGIQLTANGGVFDMFHRFTAALLADPALVQRYNALKLAQAGQPMDSYRTAKDAFIAQVLQLAPTWHDDLEG